MALRKTNQQMLDELSSAIEEIKVHCNECVHLPGNSARRNGELTSIKLQLKKICEDQHEIKDDVGMIKKKLLNPEGGVVVRVNKNKDDIEELIGYTRGFLKKCETFESDIKECKKFKNGAHKALWVVYTSIIALATKLMFFNGD